MRKFVFLTGLVSIFSGIGFQFTEVSLRLMPTEKPGLVLQLFGCMALFLGVMLVLCSRKLAERGTLVLWEGILRLGGCILMVYYGSFRDAGALVAVAGFFDGAIGLVYLLGLPKHLNRSFTDLLLDRENR